MKLIVDFKDGSTSEIAVSNSHTVRVINPQEQVQDAFGFDGVESIMFVLDGVDAPVAETPQPVVQEIVPTGDNSEQEQHDAAVQAVDTAVTAAADAETKDAAVAIIEAAQGDVEEALAQWPDSQPLLDAKAKLEQLAAEHAPQP